MKCIIVDDTNSARAVIKQLITQVEFLELINEFDNGIAAFNFLKKEEVDLIFLDIEMPDMNGLELLKTIDKKPIVILNTAKKEYAIEAFELNVADYLVKPINLARFLTAVNRAKEIFDSKSHSVETPEKDYIFIRANSVLSKVQIKDIQYIQALGDYVNIYTEEKRHTVHMNLRAIEEKLSTDLFYRIHRSYLINIDKISSIEKETAYIAKHPIPIGDVYKSTLLKKLNLI